MKPLDFSRMYGGEEIYTWRDYKGDIHYHPLYLKDKIIRQDKINSRVAKINKLKENIK